MIRISRATAATLTDLSEYTLRRRISEGVIQSWIEPGPLGRSMVDFEEIKKNFCIAINEEDLPIIKLADSGNAECQNDLALIFLANKKPKNALYWLNLAAGQKHTDAMYWIGRCYIDGNGVEKNEDTGIMWMAKAASEGHIISQKIMKSMISQITRGNKVN
jgi:TPR repeat protein